MANAKQLAIGPPNRTRWGWVAAPLAAVILAISMLGTSPALPVTAAGNSFDALGVSVAVCSGYSGRLQATFTTDGSQAWAFQQAGAANIGGSWGPGTHIIDVQYILSDALPAGTIVTRTISFGTWTSPTLYGSKTISFNCSTGEITSLIDTTPPVVVMPATMPLPGGVQGYLVEASSAGGTASFSGGTASFSGVTPTDSLGGYFGASFPVTCKPADGTLFPLGTSLKLIACSATNVAGTSTVTSTAPVTVLVVDTTPPAVVVPDDIVQEAGGLDSVVTFSVTGSDLVDGAVEATCVPPSGSTFVIGTTTVTCTATDSRGNTGSASFSVIVVDTTPPTITLPIPQMLPNGVLGYYAEATSALGAASFDGRLQDGRAYDSVDGEVLLTCAPSTGGFFPFGFSGGRRPNVVCRATDAHGNLASQSMRGRVLVADTTPPTIAQQADVTVAATGTGGAVVSYAPPVTADVVNGPGVAVCTPASGSTFSIGTTVVICTATDAHGNQAASEFAVIVLSPQQQLATLSTSIGQLGLDAGIASSLQGKVEAALKSTAPASCNQLDSLTNQVRAQTGKKLTVQQAADLTAAVIQIQSASGCS